ncbi:hypothetical protein SESBI_06458 [Sesbania bispinosa]|nr:hypothetical protein SESBI_06458 [Sesbania bispinosa]
MTSTEAKGAKEAASEAEITQGQTQEDPLTVEDSVTKAAQVLSEFKLSSNHTSPTKNPSTLQKRPFGSARANNYSWEDENKLSPTVDEDVMWILIFKKLLLRRSIKFL